jgi:hypothetical protein
MDVDIECAFYTIAAAAALRRPKYLLQIMG